MNRRVLLADDSEDMRVLLRLVLTGSDFDVVAEATDGREALDLWRTLRDDGLFAVILDHRMPGGTGLEVAAEILGTEPDARVILFSAQMDDRLRTEAMSVGICACISKEQITSLPAHPALA